MESRFIARKAASDAAIFNRQLFSSPNKHKKPPFWAAFLYFTARDYAWLIETNTIGRRLVLL